VQGKDAAYPSWFELTQEQGKWNGRFVGRVGSARPIAKIEVSGSELSFSLPVQYESNPVDMWFKGRMSDDTISGETNAEDGSTLTWTAVRAPALATTAEPAWGDPINLLEGDLAAHWKMRTAGQPETWVIKNGVLENTAKGSDLVTTQSFKDFKLHIEFNYPKDSNSGIYLRGRYEVQIEDGFGKEAHSRAIGGVYGFVTPTANASKPAGEWQSYDITFVGRTISIVLNDQLVVDKQEVPGITGGALDPDEGLPGPLMLQGDHGPISFRNVVVTPAL